MKRRMLVGLVAALVAWPMRLFAGREKASRAQWEIETGLHILDALRYPEKLDTHYVVERGVSFHADAKRGKCFLIVARYEAIDGMSKTKFHSTWIRVPEECEVTVEAKPPRLIGYWKD